MTKLASYQLPTDLSEKQIEADVASYLGWCTPSDNNAPFRLLDIDEMTTGADKLFNVGAAIYMQFKKSGGLKPTQTVSRRKNKSKIEEIREFRHELGLEDNPSLFFQLRAKAATAKDLQHNVLLSYERPPLTRAIYVAPLVLDKVSYANALFQSATRFRPFPFFYRPELMIHEREWSTIFEMVPFLREHISIPPHERVLDHNHYFSFAISGVDVAWHSSAVVTRKPSRLSDFMSEFFRTMTYGDGGPVPLQQLANQVKEISAQVGAQLPEGASPFEQLRIHGKWLRDTYDIRQFLFVANSTKMNALVTQRQ